jgi:hypothetical protein
LKIPKSIKAFGREYKIVRENSTTRKLECWGYFDDMEDTIVLRERSVGFTSGHERQVFLHEIIHIIETNLPIGLTEEQVQTIAVGLSTIIDDNKLDFTDGK